jgi:hypothetical protein
MKNKNVKALIRTRSPYERQRAKDSLSFFKLQTRSPVDRRKVKDRRSSLKLEGLAHYPDRRVNMIKCRRLGDRRKIIFRYFEYFLEKSSLIFKRPPLAR